MVLTSSWIAGLLIEGLPFLQLQPTQSGLARLFPCAPRPPTGRFRSNQKRKEPEFPNAKPTSGPSLWPECQGGEAGRKGFDLDTPARVIPSGRSGLRSGIQAPSLTQESQAFPLQLTHKFCYRATERIKRLHFDSMQKELEMNKFDLEKQPATKADVAVLCCFRPNWKNRTFG